jgi:hypothetical protein
MSGQLIQSTGKIFLEILFRFLKALVVIAVVTGLTVIGRPAQIQAEGPNAILNLEGCTQNSLPANDDGSAHVALPFTLNFSGKTLTQIWVNNNGNVTFDASQSAYRPYDLLSTQRVIIAPFFDDVDTRGTGSETVKYGSTTYAGRPAFCINWVNVGYYSYHTDKLSSFQLLLVERFDTGPGNFDIMFNYDKIQWEYTDTATYARAGYSNGIDFAYEIPGSAVVGAFLDTNPIGLIHTSRDSLQLGRFLFPVRNGVAPSGGTISGKVYANSVSSGNILANAYVQVCAGNTCHATTTTSTGAYSVMGLQGGIYTVEAFPPAGSLLSPNTIGPVTLADNQLLDGQDIALSTPTQIPPGITLSPSSSNNGFLLVNMNSPFTCTMTLPGGKVGAQKSIAYRGTGDTLGCTGATASYQILMGTTVIRQGAMVESPTGTYHANIPALFPNRGSARVETTFNCPGGSVITSSFDIYIVPTGSVKNPAGMPIANATVTLFYSDSSSGPFTQVPDQSGSMSPSNRKNPDLTDTSGLFGWDVIAGYYKIRAEKTGCFSFTNPDQSFVETSVLQIPPPAANLQLFLDCGTTIYYLFLPLVVK